MENLENIIRQYQIVIFTAAVLVFALRRIYLIRRELAELLDKSAKAVSAAAMFGGMPDFETLSSSPKASASEDECSVPLAVLAKHGALSSYTSQLMGSRYIHNIRFNARRGTGDKLENVSLSAGFWLKPMVICGREN